MIRKFLMASMVAGAFAVSACNSGDTVEAENESVDSVNKKIAAADLKPNPGRWESTMTFDKIEMPGMPPEMRDMAKGMFANMFSSTNYCLTDGVNSCCFCRCTSANRDIRGSLVLSLTTLIDS